MVVRDGTMRPHMLVIFFKEYLSMDPVLFIIGQSFNGNNDRPIFMPAFQRIFSVFKHLNIQTGASLFSKKINLLKCKQVVLIILITVFIFKIVG